MTPFQRGRWSGNTQLLWLGGDPGNTLELDLQVAEVGEYALQCVFTAAVDYGIVQLTFDGQSLGDRIDLYNPTQVITLPPTLHDLGRVSAGKHKLGIRLIGSNQAAIPSRFVGIDYIQFVLRPSIGDLREWTSTDGRTMRAKLQTVKGEQALFDLAAGEAVEVPLSHFSNSDQALIRRFATSFNAPPQPAGKRANQESQPPTAPPTKAEPPALGIPIGGELAWVEDSVINAAKPALVGIERIGQNGKITGFFASADGLVVSLSAELEGSRGVVIHTSTGEVIKNARLMALDRDNDLAIFSTGKKAPAYLKVSSTPSPVGAACAVPFHSDTGEIKVSDGQLLARRKGTDRTESRIVDVWSIVLSFTSGARAGSPVITSEGHVAGVLVMHDLRSGLQATQRFSYAIPEIAVADLLAQARAARSPVAFPPSGTLELDMKAVADPDFFPGIELKGAGNWIGAVEKFRATLTRHPGSFWTMEHLSSCLMAVGDMAAARSIIETGSRAAPDRLSFREMLGGIMAREGRLAEATKYHQTLTSEVPDYAGAWHGLGDCYLLADRKAEAAAAFKRWTELEPDSIQSWYAYATALRGSGNIDEQSRAREIITALEGMYFKLRYAAPKRHN